MKLSNFPNFIWTVNVGSRRVGSFTTRNEARAEKASLREQGTVATVDKYTVEFVGTDTRS